MKTKEQLLKVLTRLGACETARNWVVSLKTDTALGVVEAVFTPDDAEYARSTRLRSTRLSWLLWFLKRKLTAASLERLRLRVGLCVVCAIEGDRKAEAELRKYAEAWCRAR